MDKEIQVAFGRQPGQMLLDIRSAESAQAKPSRGDQGAQDANTYSRDEAPEAVNSAAASKGNAKAKGGDRRRSEYRANHPLRRPASAAEEGDRDSGRSARQLGIKWIGSYCQLHPAIPHWLFDIVKTEGGSIFRCSRCGKVKWLPSTMDTAHTMGELMYRYGDTVGYQKMLDRHPAAKRLIAKIQDIPYLQQVLPNEQFLVAVAAVMTDPEYPYYDEELIKAENLDME